MATASVNGIELDYEEAGSGPPVLLIHGTAARMWGESFDRLSTDHRVIAYDRRSFGDSRAEPPDDPRVHADDAAGLLDALGAQPAIVVGWSMGGVIALDLALRHRESVERLVLLEPPLHAKSHPTLKVLGMLLRMQLRRRRDEQAAATLFLRWVFGLRSGGSGFDTMPAAAREQLLGNAHAILKDIDLGTGEFMSKKELRTLSVPVSLLYGSESDPAFTKAAERVSRLVTGVRRKVVPGAGHGIQLDAPQAVAEAVG